MAAGGQVLIKIFTIILIVTSARSQNSVIDLNEDNWTQMLENEWMVEL